MHIRRRATAAAAVLSVFATAGARTPDPAFATEETGSSRGTVAAEDGGAPLPAAVVVVDGAGRSAITGADGAFLIDGVPAGAYRLTVTREAFAPLTSPVAVAAGQAVLLDLRLPVPAFEESIVVTATQTERVVSDVAASVTILDAEAIEASSARNLQQQTVPLRNVGYEDVRMTGRLDFNVSDAWDVTLLPLLDPASLPGELHPRADAADDHRRSARTGRQRERGNHLRAGSAVTGADSGPVRKR